MRSKIFKGEHIVTQANEEDRDAPHVFSDFASLGQVVDGAEPVPLKLFGHLIPPDLLEDESIEALPNLI